MNGLKQRVSEVFGDGPWPAIYVSIEFQRLVLFLSPGSQIFYPAATSLNPPSNRINSFGTPRGMHEICEKIGHQAASGAIFFARQETGQNVANVPIFRRHKLITSRILRLRGKEPEINTGKTASGDCCDTYERYVYIHGSWHGNVLRGRCSSGCVLLADYHMIDLFERVETRTPVFID